MTQPLAYTELDAELDAHTRERMARWRIPGATVGEVSGATHAIGEFGVSNLETGAPTHPDTLFQIGSISKIYTTTLIMMLAHEKRLDLDTPVITWLPELRLADPDARARFTLGMALCHSGGFYGDYFEDYGSGDDALGRYIRNLDGLAQQTPPGASWAYNNAGFCVAGAVIERVTSQPFERAMRERVFEPLGLTRSFYFAQDAITYDPAAGHTQTAPGGDEHEVARPYALPRAVNPAGGVIASMRDVLTFAAFHLHGGVTADGKRLLPEKTVRGMWRPRITAANFAETYATGWETRLIDGVQLVGHGGSTNGFEARLTLIPAHDYAIAALTNSARGSAMYREVIEERLAARFGLRAPKPATVSLTRTALSRFVGVYRQPDGQITLTAHGGGLRREMTFHDSLTGKTETFPIEDMRPISDREFIVITPGENEGSRLDFLLDDHGKPRYLRMGGRLNEREA